jgi:hypothetical protein
MRTKNENQTILILDWIKKEKEETMQTVKNNIFLWNTILAPDKNKTTPLLNKTSEYDALLP